MPDVLSSCSCTRARMLIQWTELFRYYDGMYELVGEAMLNFCCWAAHHLKHYDHLPHCPSQWTSEHMSTHTCTHTHHKHKHVRRKQVLKSKSSWVPLGLPDCIRMKKRILHHVFHCEELIFKHIHSTMSMYHYDQRQDTSDQTQTEKKKDPVVY